MRGTGRTARQIQEAPHGAVFVWVTGDTWYPRRLAHDLGRTDLKIVGPQWLESDAWRGCRFPGIVVDHEALARMNLRQLDLLYAVLDAVKR